MESVNPYQPPDMPANLLRPKRPLVSRCLRSMAIVLWSLGVSIAILPIPGARAVAGACLLTGLVLMMLAVWYAAPIGRKPTASRRRLGMVVLPWMSLAAVFLVGIGAFEFMIDQSRTSELERTRVEFKGSMDGQF